MKIILFVLFAVKLSVKGDLLDQPILLNVITQGTTLTKSQYELPIIIRFGTINAQAAYDALAPYTEKSVGLSSKIPRRPPEERTLRNKNIAILYAMLRSLPAFLPPEITYPYQMYAALGLDINDQSLNLSTPVGIGNYAGMMIKQQRENDGLNELGTEGGKKYQLKKFEDNTNYVPKNTAYKLMFPGNWQPNIQAIGFGTFFVQQHLLPQFRKAKPYALKSIHTYTSPRPISSDPKNMKSYRKQADEVINESKNLNSYRKTIAEYFDSTPSFFDPFSFLITKYRLSYDDVIILNFLYHIVLFDAGVVTWKEKIKHDAVRPFSAIRYLYENKKLTAWGGPGMGTVSDIKGKEWQSYIPTRAYSEYPSSTVCFCSAMFTFMQKYLNTTDFGFSITKAQGSSVIEPNITPASNITLGPFVTFDDYIDECANSRVWGGVNFRSSVDSAKYLCKPIANEVYKTGMKYVNGDITV